MAAEAHHPGRELDRVGDPRVAGLHVQVQQVAREIADRPVGVIGAQDHLHGAARYSSTTRSLDGALATASRNSSTIGRAARAHSELSR